MLHGLAQPDSGEPARQINTAVLELELETKKPTPSGREWVLL
jgi:hypothetical protein